MPPTVDRRTLIKLAALGAGAAATGCRPQPSPAEPAAAAGSATSPPAFELEELTVAELQAGMAEGRWTARRLCELYLARIEAVDRTGPAVNSVIATDPAALAAADRLDEERRGGRLRGPLHGVPVLLKDNIETAGAMETTAGSLAVAGRPAGRDAFLTARLREAGAVILGKTNLSEWANFRSERSSSGWSAVGGQTRNPYALDRNPCGSSSGSGAAVAANFCAVAVGTETDGSVVCPSSATGIVGIKPTLGLVSRTGVVPLAHSQDTAGPMARTVADAVALLTAMAGTDPADGATRQAPWTGGVELGADPVRALRGARLGVWRERFGFHERVDRLMEEALAALGDAGAELVDPVGLELAPELDEAEMTVLLYEFKADLDAYLAGRGQTAQVADLAALIEFNRRHRDREMPYFEQELFERAQEKGPLSDPAYAEALAACGRLTRERGLGRALAANRLDALLAPTGGPAWVTDLVNGDHFGGGSSQPAAVAGYPNVTVPAGFVFGLPVGISFIGAAWSEPRLLRLAAGFEQATRHRRAPRLLPSAELEVEPRAAFAA